MELDGTAALTSGHGNDQPGSPDGLVHVRAGNTVEDVQGYEAALRMDIRSVMSDKLDDLIINGQAAVERTTSPYCRWTAGLSEVRRTPRIKVKG